MALLLDVSRPHQPEASKHRPPPGYCSQRRTSRTPSVLLSAGNQPYPFDIAHRVEPAIPLRYILQRGTSRTLGTVADPPCCPPPSRAQLITNEALDRLDETTLGYSVTRPFGARALCVRVE